MNRSNLGLGGLALIVGLSGCGTANLKSDPMGTMRNNAYVLSEAQKYKSGIDLLKAAANCRCVEGFSMPAHYFNQTEEVKNNILNDVMKRYTSEQLAGISIRYIENKAYADMGAWSAEANKKDLISTAFWTVVLAYSGGKAASSSQDATVTVGRGSVTRTIGDVTH